VYTVVETPVYSSKAEGFPSASEREDFSVFISGTQRRVPSFEVRVESGRFGRFDLVLTKVVVKVVV
jgi:hypothetical protein